MSKPQMVNKIVVTGINQEYRLICITTDPYTIKELDGLGQINKWNAPTYNFFVDARYDFNEVVEYVKSLNESPKTEE